MILSSIAGYVLVPQLIAEWILMAKRPQVYAEWPGEVRCYDPIRQVLMPVGCPPPHYLLNHLANNREDLISSKGLLASELAFPFEVDFQEGELGKASPELQLLLAQWEQRDIRVTPQAIARLNPCSPGYLMYGRGGRWIRNTVPQAQPLEPEFLMDYLRELWPLSHSVTRAVQILAEELQNGSGTALKRPLVIPPDEADQERDRDNFLEVLRALAALSRGRAEQALALWRSYTAFAQVCDEEHEAQLAGQGGRTLEDFAAPLLTLRALEHDWGHWNRNGLLETLRFMLSPPFSALLPLLAGARAPSPAGEEPEVSVENVPQKPQRGSRAYGRRTVG